MLVYLRLNNYGNAVSSLKVLQLCMCTRALYSEPVANLMHVESWPAYNLRARLLPPPVCMAERRLYMSFCYCDAVRHTYIHETCTY